MNNNLSVTMTTVKIGDKVLTIMSDTVDPVMEAGAALEKYFNVVPEESEIEEAEAGAVEAVLPALPSEDAMAGEMETESSGQATEMPAPAAATAVRVWDTSAVFVLKHLSTKVPPASQDSSVWKAAELAVPELEVASATRKVLENIALSIN